MKRCKRCGRELDESEFYKHKRTKDGLQPYCKECQRELTRMRIKPKLPQLKVPQIGGGKVNPELAAFTPRQLMEELKARGYTGELKYTQTIKL